MCLGLYVSRMESLCRRAINKNVNKSLRTGKFLQLQHRLCIWTPREQH